MPLIEEGKLAFDFDDARWQALRWDAPNPAYENGIRKLDECKAVDLIGLHDQAVLYFIEVKDYRYYSREKKVPVPFEFAWKVRDTIAGLIGAHRHGGYPDLAPFVAALANPQRRIKTVLWLEDLEIEKPKALSLKASIEQRLCWLHGSRSEVLHRKLDYQKRIPDLTVSSLPGGGLRSALEGKRSPGRDDEES